ncbi:MAG: hypothetical protein HS110_14550 [Zoogloeaceae bacterium]|nr:hypothetical protein [Zoogloeaceae bacterium]MCK6383406.1 hypothetical protein [Rhodocyclaceae bacterium]
MRLPDVDFDLPTLGNDLSPAFASARGCRDWLAVQPLANPSHAQAMLLRQVNLLNRYALAPAERLKILELLRDPIAFAQTESARKFAGRPLPLAPPEQAGMDTNRTLWQAVRTGYLHCLAACLEGQAELRPHAALIVQRVIGAVRAELFDIYRAPTDPPAQLWRLLHRVYAAAESLAALTQPVNDSLQSSHSATSVVAAYAHTLLLHRASPYELSGRQLAQVERWLHRWSGKVAALNAPPAEPRVPPLVVDLSASVPEASAEGGEQLRWLDLSELSRSVKRRIAHLQKGESPASLGLGEDCAQPACENLLRHLYRNWFKGGAPRQHPRHAGSGACQLVTGLDAIQYYLSGKIFRQPGQGDAMSKTQIEEIATFGRVATRHEDDYSKLQGFVVESWCVLDESATGFRLTRPLSQAGGRIGGGQMVAIRPGSGRGYLLAVARWARITAGELQAGIQIMPGLPQTVALRGTGLTAINEKYRPGFRMAAVPALEYPESVVVPAGWFRPGRVIEMYDESSRQIRLTRQLDRGSDHERCTYESL